MVGFDDGTFRPGDNVTRGQAAYWFGNYNNSLELVEEETDPQPNNIFFTDSACPSGKRAVAGGGWSSSSDLYMTDSLPVVNGTIWRVRWETEGNVIMDPSSVDAWALCVPNTIP